MLNVSKNYVYMLEKGREPGKKVISQVSRIEAEVRSREAGSPPGSLSPPLPSEVRESRCEYGTTAERLTAIESELDSIRKLLVALLAQNAGGGQGDAVDKDS